MADAHRSRWGRPSDAESKRWRVEMADKTTRTIEAHGFRIEGGGLIFVRPAGCVAAYAPGCWRTIEETHNTEG
jgi:hypothetical protein